MFWGIWIVKPHSLAKKLYLILKHRAKENTRENTMSTVRLWIYFLKSILICITKKVRNIGKKTMAKSKSIFLSGLKVFIPFLVTLLLLYWIFIGCEKIFRNILLLFMNPAFYFTGLGWIAVIIFTALVGLLVQIPLIKKTVDQAKKQFLKLPLIKSRPNKNEYSKIGIDEI